MPSGIYQRSDATKMRLRNMGIAQRGIRRPDETRRKISEAMKGIKRSKETREKISEANRGRSNLWKGGRAKHSEGYVLIYSPIHPHAECKGYVSEHRLVMEEHIGRLLLRTEVVHHRNGIRDDNRIENLMLFSTPGAHISFHAKSRKMHKPPVKLGPQEPPNDPRIFNRRRSDGTFPTTLDFFEGKR